MTPWRAAHHDEYQRFVRPCAEVGVGWVPIAVSPDLCTQFPALDSFLRDCQFVDAQNDATVDRD
jgi:hypothetical protein